MPRLPLLPALLLLPILSPLPAAAVAPICYHAPVLSQPGADGGDHLAHPLRASLADERAALTPMMR